MLKRPVPPKSSLEKEKVVIVVASPGNVETFYFNAEEMNNNHKLILQYLIDNVKLLKERKTP